MKQRLLKIVVLAIKEFRDPYYQGFAAQLSFYFLLSLVPIVLLISHVLTAVFSQDLETALGWLVNYINRDLPANFKNLITGGSSGTMSVFFFIVAFWASSKAQFSMMRIANFIMTGGTTTGDGYIKDRLRALGTMGITMLTILFALVVMLYGELIIGVIVNIFNLKISSSQIWLILRWPVAVVLYFFMISYNYYVLPSVTMKYRDVIPGSIFSALGLLIVTWIYTEYISSLANYNVIYGSLATIAAVLIWFYLLAWVLTLGILFNRVWWESKI